MEKDEDQKRIDIIVNKWHSLQQVIKEGITLNEIIEKQKIENKKTLCQKYFDYYKNQLLVREMGEKTNNIDNDIDKFISFELINKEAEIILSDAYIPTEKLFQLLRNDFQFIGEIASILERNINKLDADQESCLESIVDLFCHQFYENILIPNPEHEELLILCSLLLEQEIKNMTTLSISSFIDEHFTFIGKFLKSFTKKPELKNYLSMTLGSIILNVENSGELFMDLNPIKILKNLKTFEMTEGLFATFENNRQLGSFYSKTTGSTVSQNNNNNGFNQMLDKETDMNDFIKPILMRQRLNSSEAYLIKEFIERITLDDLLQRIINEKDDNMKEFLKKQIERFGNDKDIYTCNQFINSLNQFKEKDSIIGTYVNNYEIIKSLIDNIIRSLVSNVGTMPYALRCICKIICILIQRKFPHISIYERNAFIGEFIFGKCILPIFVDSDKNGVVTSSILSGNIRECLKIAAKVLVKISRNLLFDSAIDMNYTIFNHYIIEIIPEINNFCNELIKVKLPNVVDDLINEKIDYATMTNYKYFDENKEELVNLQCVCYSIQDILTLINYIEPLLNTTTFQLNQDTKGNRNLFYKTMQKLIGQRQFLEQTIKATNKRQFFLTFQDEENPYKKELLGLSQEKFAFFTNQDTTQLILSKVKYCIIVILQELNLINNKVYSYLNKANTNLNFFNAINQTLQIEEVSSSSSSTNETENDKIPLNWYSIYLISNLPKLEDKYKENDYLLLSDELYKEEDTMIEKLKIKSNLIITKYGMNIRCAETLVQKSKSELLRAEKINKTIKTKKIISNGGINVCITSMNENNRILLEEGKGNRKTIIPGDKNKRQKIRKASDLFGSSDSLFDLNSNICVFPVDRCVHEDVNEIEVNEVNMQKRSFHSKNNGTGNKDKGCEVNNPSHVSTVKEFIKLYGDFQEVRDDIFTGKQINNAAKSLTCYLSIMKKIISNSVLFANEFEVIEFNNRITKAEEVGKRSIEGKRLADKIVNERNVFIENCNREFNDIIEKVRYFILKRIYIKVYPVNPLPQDMNFYRKTMLISWITPQHLDIKKIFLNEKLWELAINSLNKMDNGRTPQDKINCIANAYGFINRSIKFCSGKDSDSGAEELTPIFQFILIKAQPRRLYSNINYIRGICDPSNENDPYKSSRDFFLGQIEAAAVFVNEVTYKHLNVTKEVFDKNVEEKSNEYKLSFSKGNISSQNNSPNCPNI